jgi:hypothetical protein
MKFCLMILSVPWYMFEHNAILSQFVIFITGNWVREKPLKKRENLGLGPPICPLF